MLHGNTKVIASISGPKHPQKSKNRDESFVFNVRVKFATFSKNGERQKVVKNSKKLGEIEINLKNIFKSVILVEKYEKSQLDLNIEILQTDGGSDICTAVNAATLALIDAGICMKEYICACTASLTNEGIALLDVSHLEEICGMNRMKMVKFYDIICHFTGGPTLTIAALPRVGENEQSVAFIELSQKFYLKDLNKIFDCALMGCEKIRGILDEAIRTNAFEFVSSELTH
jgi:exosome complex component RRP41